MRSPSAASKTATVLLPGFSFAEAEGTYTNVERRVQRLRPALLPSGQMRANWQIVAEIAAAMGGAGFELQELRRRVGRDCRDCSCLCRLDL